MNIFIKFLILNKKNVLDNISFLGSFSRVSGFLFIPIDLNSRFEWTEVFKIPFGGDRGEEGNSCPRPVNILTDLFVRFEKSIFKMFFWLSHKPPSTTTPLPLPLPLA